MNARLPGQPQVKTIEVITHVAPLGLRFWDAVTNSVVGSGLVVTAYALGNPDRTMTAIANRTAIYAFHHLPGLRDLENGAGDDAYWQAVPPKTRLFHIDVVDLERRFLPASFLAAAPTRGLATLLCGSPPLPFTFASPLSPLASPSGVIDAIPLFSAPNRAVPAGMAVIRAQVWDSAAGRAAAWAMVEALPPGQPPARGITDTKGALTLIFPYPAPTSPAVGVSPLAAPRVPLWQQSWPIPLRAFYSALETPTLCDIVQQPAATLWASQSPEVELSETILSAGAESILRPVGESVPPATIAISALP